MLIETLWQLHRYNNECSQLLKLSSLARPLAANNNVHNGLTHLADNRHPAVVTDAACHDRNCKPSLGNAELL